MSWAKPTRLLTGAAIIFYFLFQDSINIPDHILAHCILAWGVMFFLDMHSTIRTPSMMKHETNPLFAAIHSRLSWGAFPLQMCVELLILGTVSLLTSDPFQTFGLICICTGASHVWCWRKNEIFRLQFDPQTGEKISS